RRGLGGVRHARRDLAPQGGLRPGGGARPAPRRAAAIGGLGRALLGTALAELDRASSLAPHPQVLLILDRGSLSNARAQLLASDTCNGVSGNSSACGVA